MEKLEKAILCTERQMPVLLQTHGGEHSHWNYSTRQCQSKPKMTTFFVSIFYPIFFLKVRLMEDMDGKRFLFEVYSDTNTHIKGCKKNYTGEVVQGRHKTYRYKNTKQLKKKIEKKN